MIKTFLTISAAALALSACTPHQPTPDCSWNETRIVDGVCVSNADDRQTPAAVTTTAPQPSPETPDTPQPETPPVTPPTPPTPPSNNGGNNGGNPCGGNCGIGQGNGGGNGTGNEGGGVGPNK